MRTIRQSYEIQASASQVFKALTTPSIIEKWSGAPAEMQALPGAAFSLWGGQIIGKNLEVVPDKKLVQEWRESSWPVPSKVTFTITPTANGSRIDLLHEDVPAASAKDIDSGWREYYLGPLQEMFTGQ